MEVKKSRVILGLLPAAMVTAMVSPTAREKARITEAAIPDRAAGTTTRRLTCRLVEPRPKAASRRDAGTDRMASSLIEAMIGRIISPTAIDPAAALKTNTRSSPKIGRSRLGVTNWRAKYPTITVGMPARISRVGLSTPLTRGLAYSER